MEASDKIKEVFKLCKFRNININLDESYYRPSGVLKKQPCICIGNNNITNIIEELETEGSSKITWDFFGSISNTIKECFEFMGYIIKIENEGSKGTVSLIIDDNDFIVSSLKDEDLYITDGSSSENDDFIVSSLKYEDLDNKTDESSSENDEIIIHVNKDLLVELDTSDDEIDEFYYNKLVNLQLSEIENQEIDDEEIDNQEIDNEEIEDEEIDNQEIDNQEIEDEELEDEEIEDEEIEDEEIEDEEIDNQEIDNQEIDDEELDNQEIDDEIDDGIDDEELEDENMYESDDETMCLPGCGCVNCLEENEIYENKI
jgi:hypothetical protein